MCFTKVSKEVLPCSFKLFPLKRSNGTMGKLPGKAKTKQREGRGEREEPFSAILGTKDCATSQKSFCFTARLTFLSSALSFPNSLLRRPRDHFAFTRQSSFPVLLISNIFPCQRKIFDRSGVFFVSDTAGILEKEDPSSPNRSRTYVLRIMALPSPFNQNL